MTSKKTLVTFYYDVVSPWAYIGLEVLKRYQKPWNLDLRLRPVFLGGVMSASHNQPPISVPNKGMYMGNDLARVSKFYELSVTLPKKFPINSLAAVRLLRVIQEKHPDKLEEATTKFYQAYFSPQSFDYSKTSTYSDLLTPSPFDAPTLESLIAESNAAVNKDRIKSESVELVEKGGAFGFPWIVVRREDGVEQSWFGSDRFEIMAWWLGKRWEGPVPKDSKL